MKLNLENSANFSQQEIDAKISVLQAMSHSERQQTIAETLDTHKEEDLTNKPAKSIFKAFKSDVLEVMTTAQEFVDKTYPNWK